MSGTSPAPGSVVVNPRTGEPVTAAQAFAAWLEQHEPDLFQALLKQAATEAKASGLGDWSSILSSIGNVAGDIGSGISDAASSVGSYLTSSQGLSSLSNLASTYLQSQTQQSVTQMQLARAQQGLPPAPVSYATNSAGQVVPVYTAGNLPPSLTGSAQPLNLGNGQTGYQLNSQALATLAGSSTLKQYLPWILLGGGALLLGGLLLMRK